MALWDKIFKKKDETPGKLNPIVQKSPAPAAPVRVSSAKPVPKPVEAAPAKSRPKSSATLPAVEEAKPKKQRETGTKVKANDDAAFLKRGMARQAKGDHDGAIADFSKAIELNPECVQAYASRGVSKDAKGDTNGAKADYSTSISIQITAEINRQIRENPEVDL
ncbi:MAG TPA: tetratricopeptide repeat protein [Planctomycetota bacterium]|nr:tetratricopeptide repeat protein [Planctomycetota bacterium]